MLELLNALYRECSMIPSPTPDQSHALAGAAMILGSCGIPSALVREAFEVLRTAFGK
ncbi:hypothetical protein SAMN05443248_3500 [Bradyrhizobium erythrophlei]|uniref:Uncharacterized protein n=1 Tax=Bradyrhizobium erythrophlei TaxID=1437360 RepID=A0A1M5PTT6_9BRAD|nr:hypothetical protein SAMN05443248_3500 [Bradyrhizobium erythrophlei]